MWWVMGIVAAVVMLSGYLTWTARRVTRLHARAESARRALDAHLVRRAAAAAVVAEHRESIELYAAARVALDAVPDEREAAENDLTRQLRTVRLGGDPAWETLVAASRRAALARQVHTDLVRDALTARDRPLVRALRMARAHHRPTYFDIVEPTLPEPLPGAGAPGSPAAAVGSGVPGPAMSGAGVSGAALSGAAVSGAAVSGTGLSDAVVPGLVVPGLVVPGATAAAAVAEVG